MQELDPRRASTFGARAEEYERWRPSYPPAAVAWLVPPADREPLIAAMVAVVTAEAGRRGTPTVPLRQSAHCVRWRPNPGR